MDRLEDISLALPLYVYVDSRIAFCFSEGHRYFGRRPVECVYHFRKALVKLRFNIASLLFVRVIRLPVLIRIEILFSSRRGGREDHNGCSPRGRAGKGYEYQVRWKSRWMAGSELGNAQRLVRELDGSTGMVGTQIRLIVMHRQEQLEGRRKRCSITGKGELRRDGDRQCLLLCETLSPKAIKECECPTAEIKPLMPYLHVLSNDFVSAVTGVKGTNYRECVLTQYFLEEDNLLLAACSEKHGRVFRTKNARASYFTFCLACCLNTSITRFSSAFLSWALVSNVAVARLEWVEFFLTQSTKPGLLAWEFTCSATLRRFVFESKRPASMRSWYSASFVGDGMIRLPSAAEAENLDAAFLMPPSLTNAASIALDILSFVICPRWAWTD